MRCRSSHRSYVLHSLQPLMDRRVKPGDDTEQEATAIQLNCYSLYFPHTSSAISTTSRIWAHCCASVSTLPSSVEAKPHCGLSAICSIGMNFAASSSRRLTVSLLSKVPLFEVTTPTAPAASSRCAVGVVFQEGG